MNSRRFRRIALGCGATLLLTDHERLGTNVPSWVAVELLERTARPAADQAIKKHPRNLLPAATRAPLPQLCEGQHQGTAVAAGGAAATCLPA